MDSIESLEVQMRSLERQFKSLRRVNRRWKLAGVMSLSAAIAVFIGGAGARKALEVEEIVLRDETGATRLSLSLLDNDRPVIGLFNRKGERLIALGEGVDGDPVLKFRDRNGTDRGGIGAIAPRDAFGLCFKDREGKYRLGLGVEADGLTSLHAKDGNGKARVSIEMESEGSPHLLLLDAEGKAIFEVPDH